MVLAIALDSCLTGTQIYSRRTPAMTRMVKCVKLNTELPALPFKPFKNELGDRLYNAVSMDAWRMWLEHSKMIINEYRLDLTEKRAHEILLAQCEEFFFGEGSAPPPDYVETASE